MEQESKDEGTVDNMEVVNNFVSSFVVWTGYSVVDVGLCVFSSTYNVLVIRLIEQTINNANSRDDTSPYLNNFIRARLKGLLQKQTKPISDYIIEA